MPRSKLAQIWPMEMRRKISQGIMQVLKTYTSKGKRDESYMSYSGQKQFYPSYGDSTYDGCPGCRAHKVSTDPSHTREEEGVTKCKFPHTKTIEYSCPGCMAGKPSKHELHTNVLGECRMPSSRPSVQGTGLKRVPDLKDPASSSSSSGDPLTRKRQTVSDLGGAIKEDEVMQDKEVRINREERNKELETLDKTLIDKERNTKSTKTKIT